MGISEAYKRISEEVRLNRQYEEIAQERTQALGEIGMLAIEIAKNQDLGDEEITERIQAISHHSVRIAKAAKELHLKEQVDFSFVKRSTRVMEKLTEWGLRLLNLQDRAKLIVEYEALVGEGRQKMADLGTYLIERKNEKVKNHPNFKPKKEAFDKIHEEFLQMGRRIKIVQVLGKERDEPLVPLLTFIASMLDFAQVVLEKLWKKA